MADVALLRTALGDLAAVLGSVTDDEGRRPSGCRGWSVLDLAYHLVEDAHRTLVHLNSPADGPADTDDVEYWRPGRPSPHDGEDAAIAAGIRERIGDLARRHGEACAAVLVAVGRVRLDDVVRGQGAAMTVAGELSHLRARGGGPPPRPGGAPRPAVRPGDRSRRCGGCWKACSGRRSRRRGTTPPRPGAAPGGSR
jgi:hypothetical protein